MERLNDWIAYKDDNEEIVRRFVTVKKKEASYVEFEADEVILVIPWIRVIKLKQKGDPI